MWCLSGITNICLLLQPNKPKKLCSNGFFLFVFFSRSRGMPHPLPLIVRLRLRIIPAGARNPKLDSRRIFLSDIFVFIERSVGLSISLISANGVKCIKWRWQFFIFGLTELEYSTISLQFLAIIWLDPKPRALRSDKDNRLTLPGQKQKT